MKYIPDKNLYSAVMFALKMCPSLQYAFDSKITVAANYYHVNRSDVLKIVKEELWKRAISEAKEEKDRWYTIFNHEAMDLLGTGWGNDYVLICPHCGAHYSCNVHDDMKINRLYVSRCKCGFVDMYQREYVRKNYFKTIYKED